MTHLDERDHGCPECRCRRCECADVEPVPTCACERADVVRGGLCAYCHEERATAALDWAAE